MDFAGGEAPLGRLAVKLMRSAVALPDRLPSLLQRSWSAYVTS